MGHDEKSGKAMVLQAGGFGLLAAISPTALLVLSLYLASANPKRMVMFYLAGAILTTIVVAVALIIAIRATGLDQPREHTPRYGLRLGLGVLALIAAAVLAWRRPRSGDEPERDPQREAEQNPGDPRRPKLMDRLTTRPAPGIAFAAGVVVFTPSAAFIAAIQTVATARAGTPLTALAIALVVVLTITVVWVPFMGYLASPQNVTRWLVASVGWVRRYGRQLTEAGLVVCGFALVLNGCLGLTAS